jgi:protein-disulfide isomerase
MRIRQLALILALATFGAATAGVPSRSAALAPADAPSIGPADAPVTVVEFFDPACEACRAMYPHVKQILAKHPLRVRLVIRYTPFHGEPSMLAARILEAARAQGRFEPVLENVLRFQPLWTGHAADHAAPDPARAWDYAVAAGLDRAAAEAHLASGAADALLLRDLAAAKAERILGTPTFFVNGKPLAKLDPHQLLAMVEGELAASPKPTQ